MKEMTIDIPKIKQDIGNQSPWKNPTYDVALQKPLDSSIRGTKIHTVDSKREIPLELLKSLLSLVLTLDSGRS